MFTSNIDGMGLEKLLDDKSLSAEQRRRIIATSIALKFIAAALGMNNSPYKLSEEMQNLSKYVDAIEAGLTPRKM